MVKNRSSFNTQSCWIGSGMETGSDDSEITESVFKQQDTYSERKNTKFPCSLSLTAEGANTLPWIHLCGNSLICIALHNVKTCRLDGRWLVTRERVVVLSLCTNGYCTNAGVQTDKPTLSGHPSLAWKKTILVQGGSATFVYSFIYITQFGIIIDTKNKD